MTQLGFFIDLTKCTGCQTCTVACKDAHAIPVQESVNPVNVLELTAVGKAVVYPKVKTTWDNIQICHSRTALINVFRAAVIQSSGL